MLRKSLISTILNNEPNQSITSRLTKLTLDKNVNNKDPGFQFSEFDLDNIIDETDHLFNKCTDLKLGLSQQRKIKNHNIRLKYLSESSISIVTSTRKIRETNHKRQILFPSRRENVKSTFCKYIPLSAIDDFTQWNRYSKKRPFVDFESLVNKNINEPNIKQLKPNYFKKGFDIIPNYLNMKTKRYAKKTDNLINSHYDSKVILKAYKAFTSSTKKIVNVCFVGPSKSGKSTIIGSILLHRDALDHAFLKKTRWEAKKACATECSLTWLLDTSSHERFAGETIVPSTHEIQTENKIIRLTDNPGNEAYFHETLRSFSVTDIVVLVLDIQSINSFTDYLHNFFKLLKVFSLMRLIIVFTNTLSESCQDVADIIKNIYRCYGKWKPLVFTVSKLSDVQHTEVTSILTSIDVFDVTNDASRLESPLLIEVIDIHKSVDSALPVVAGRVVAGGVSAGINNPLSAAVIVPGSVQCVVKSLKIEENGGMKTRSFAFAGDTVELTFPEVIREDMIRRGSLICHRQFSVQCFNVVRGRLMMLRSAREDHVPVINGSIVYMWTRTRSVMATVVRIESMEMAGTKSTLIKSPRLISHGAQIATVTFKTEEQIPVLYATDDVAGYKLDIFLLFHNSTLFAAGRFLVER